jgi:hypothetical protein
MLAALRNDTHGAQQLSEPLEVALSVLSDDPSGFLWIVVAANLLTVICGIRKEIWCARVFKALVFTQLLIVPVAAAIGFHYATRPPA